ncbi:hypothetical protein [Xanthomonas sp. CFBP 7912]|nr:hypothetical protein [Xanthomonas sp. CFBP 7912]
MINLKSILDQPAIMKSEGHSVSGVCLAVYLDHPITGGVDATCNSSRL